MSRQIVWCFIFVLTLLEVSLNTKLTAHGKTHGALHDTLIDGVTFQEWGGAASPAWAEPVRGAVRLLPARLDFGTRELARPHALSVQLTNTANHTLHLASVSSTTPDFHASFFDTKSLPPLANTTFSIVYLGRRLGPAAAALYIHTSRGVHKYEVAASGAPSPYRVRPELLVRGEGEPLRLHNPGPEPLQVTHVYSSAGWLTVEPAGGAAELWAVPPGRARRLATLRAARRAGRAYLRVGLAGRPSLLLAVAAAAPGALAVSPGAVWLARGTRDAAAEVALQVAGPAGAAVAARARLDCAAPAAELAVRLEGRALPAGGRLGAVLRARWAGEAVRPGLVCAGELLVEDVSVPLLVQLYPGGLLLSEATVVTDEAAAPLELTATNRFEFPVRLLELEVPPEIDVHFHRSEFVPRSLAPGERAVLCALALRAGAAPELELRVLLHTDLSVYSLPVAAYPGRPRLRWAWPGGAGGALHAGLLPLGAARSVSGRLLNPGPRVLCVAARVRLAGASWRGPACVGPRRSAPVRLTLRAPAAPGQLAGRLVLHGPRGASELALSVRGAAGRLAARASSPRGCAPYCPCRSALRLANSFAPPLRLEGAAALSPGLRWLGRPGRVPPGDSAAGWLDVFPEEHCRPLCYTGMDLEDEESAAWYRRGGQVRAGADLEGALLADLRQWGARRARLLAAPPALALRAALLLDGACAPLSLAPRLAWPALVPAAPPALPAALPPARPARLLLVSVRNPARRPLLVQPVLPARPPPALRRLADWGGAAEPAAFRLDHWRLPARRPPGPLVLRPGARALLAVAFLPRAARPAAAPLLLRNNLTVLEAVVLRGAGAAPRVTLGGRAPGGPALRLAAGPGCRARAELLLRNAGRAALRAEGARAEGAGFRLRAPPAGALPPGGSLRLELEFVPERTLSRRAGRLTVRLSPGGPARWTLSGALSRAAAAECGTRPSWERWLSWLCGAGAAGLTVASLLAGALGAGAPPAPRAPRPPRRRPRPAPSAAPDSAGEDAEVAELRGPLCGSSESPPPPPPRPSPSPPPPSPPARRPPRPRPAPPRRAPAPPRPRAPRRPRAAPPAAPAPPRPAAPAPRPASPAPLPRRSPPPAPSPPPPRAPSPGPIAPPADRSLFYFNRGADSDRWQETYKERSSVWGGSGWGESGRGESGWGESVRVDGRVESGWGESGRADSGWGESARVDSGQTEAAWCEPGRVESTNRVDPAWAESTRVESGRVEPGWAESKRVETGQIEPGWGESKRVESGRVEPGWGQSGWGQSGWGESGWGQWGTELAPPPGFSQSAGMRAFDPFQSLSSIWSTDGQWASKEEDEATPQHFNANK